MIRDGLVYVRFKRIRRGEPRTAPYPEESLMVQQEIPAGAFTIPVIPDNPVPEGKVRIATGAAAAMAIPPDHSYGTAYRELQERLQHAENAILTLAGVLREMMPATISVYSDNPYVRAAKRQEWEMVIRHCLQPLIHTPVAQNKGATSDDSADQG